MYEEAQQEIEAMAVWPALRGNLWHATSVAKADAIIRDGVVRIDDTSTYRSSHCHKMGCVSLFDFSEPLEQIASQFLNWHGWFGYQTHLKGKATVWLQVDREAVRGSVKTVKETHEEWAANGYAQYIPFVEVGHHGPMPLTAITGALVVSREDRTRFQMIEPGPDWHARIEAYAATLPEIPPPSDFEKAIMEAYRKAERPPG
jgi:hypothetical protein